MRLDDEHLYRLWKRIKVRCYNKNTRDYQWYGKRGVIVCDGWKHDYLAFKEYILLNLGERPTGMTLDRIRNNGNYEPDNLRWASRRMQCINQGNRKDNKSGYKGVDFHEATKKWQARISAHGKRINLGVHKTKGLAVFAINRFIVENSLPHKVQKIEL